MRKLQFYLSGKRPIVRVITRLDRIFVYSTSNMCCVYCLEKNIKNTRYLSKIWFIYLLLMWSACRMELEDVQNCSICESLWYLNENLKRQHTSKVGYTTHRYTSLYLHVNDTKVHWPFLYDETDTQVGWIGYSNSVVLGGYELNASIAHRWDPTGFKNLVHRPLLEHWESTMVASVFDIFICWK